MRFAFVCSLLMLSSCSQITHKSERTPASTVEPLTGDILGCYGSSIVEYGKGKKKISQESKAVVYRGFEGSGAGLTSPYDLGKVIVLSGSRGGFDSGVTSSRYSYETLEELNAMKKFDKIPAPQNVVLEARQDNAVVYVVKAKDGKYLAINQDRSYGNEFKMDQCTTDVEQVRAWIQEVSRYSPF